MVEAEESVDPESRQEPKLYYVKLPDRVYEPIAGKDQHFGILGGEITIVQIPSVEVYLTEPQENPTED